MPIIKRNKNVRIAIIGCGNFGNFHLNNLLNMENVEVVAFYNRGFEKLEKIGARVPKARLYQDLDKLFAKENFDAAIVSLTPTAHGKIEELCCKKKVHMFVEKPIELDLENAKKMSEEIKLANIITSVGYNGRYNPAIDKVKEMLEKEPVGLVTASWVGMFPKAAWWGQKELSGGQLVEQATHVIDLLRYLFGDAESLYFSGKRDAELNPGVHDVEDFSCGIIKFKSGVIANVHAACYLKEKMNSKIGIEILMAKYKLFLSWGGILTITGNGETNTFDFKSDYHVPCLATFIEAVKTGDAYLIKSSYEDGVKSLELSLKANQSMQSGEMIKI